MAFELFEVKNIVRICLAGEFPASSFSPWYRQTTVDEIFVSTSLLSSDFLSSVGLEHIGLLAIRHHVSPQRFETEVRTFWVQTFSLP